MVNINLNNIDSELNYLLKALDIMTFVPTKVRKSLNQSGHIDLDSTMRERQRVNLKISG